MSSTHPTPSKTVALADAQIRLGGAAKGLAAFFGIVGIAGLVAGAALGWNRGDGLQYFLHSYLYNYCFVLSIALGLLCFVLLQHATRAGWSATVRRLAEIFAANFDLLAILALPIVLTTVFGQYNIYDWAKPDAAKESHALAQKLAYLNPTFFGIRAIFYFAVWIFLGRFYLTQSLKQDSTGDIDTTLRMERWSYVSILLLALTITFAAFDWLMSLMPEWYSTIFGLYYFSGGMVGAMAALILAAVAMQSAGRLTKAITVEHYHDLGKLLFAFIVFWGYMAFSQYLLIWYANMPEETQWFLLRQNSDWKWVSVALLFGHLFIPFVAMLSRHIKRQKYLLTFWAIWMLAMHWLDLYWVVMPSLKTERSPFEPIDVCLLIGFVGLYAASVMLKMSVYPLAPLADPRLEEALAFENA